MIVDNLQELKRLSVFGRTTCCLFEVDKKYKTNVLGLKLGDEYTYIHSYGIVVSYSQRNFTTWRVWGTIWHFRFEIMLLGKEKRYEQRQLVSGMNKYIHWIDMFFMYVIAGIAGITCTDGELWNNQRKFVYHHLRNLGYGKKLTEEMIRNEPNIQINKFIAPVILSILWTLSIGGGMSKKESQFNEL